MNKATKLNTLSVTLIIALIAMVGLYIFQLSKAAQPNAEKFGEQVRAYLLTNPSVIREAIEVLSAQERQADKKRKEDSLATFQNELENDGYSFVAGNPDGDVTIVEFFDYRCGYCKRSFPDIMKTVEEDGNIRLVLKEFPILGEQSVLASQAVLASQNQGKYMEFHNALMQARGGLTKDRIMQIGGDIGLDTVKLEKDMKSETVTGNIRKTYDLARALDINGTPAFVIGGKLAAGAIPAEQMKMMVAEARKEKAASATN